MVLPYEQYFEAMPCYLSVQDRDFKIVKANQRFCNDFGNYEYSDPYLQEEVEFLLRESNE